MAHFIKTVGPDMTSYNGFKWPESGRIAVERFNLEPVCDDGGFYGLHKGMGDSSYLNWSADAKWILFESDTFVEFEGKAKTADATIIAVGDRKTITDLMVALYPDAPVHGCSKWGGDESTVTGGDWSTVTGGDWSTVTGGDWSTVTGGNRSTVTGGNRSTVTGGNRSTVTGGHGSVLSLKYWDGMRTRIAIGYVGEFGIEPNVAYKVVDGKFVKAEA